MRKIGTAVLALILLVIIALPATVTFVNAQTNREAEENLVEAAEKAGNQVQALIANVYADPNATQKIEGANLTSQFESYVAQYQNEGVTKLAQAKEALTRGDYSAASELSLYALGVFRSTFSALQATLKAAGANTDSGFKNQELLDAINRDLQRVENLAWTVTANASQNTLQAIDDANKTLLEAKTALLNGQADYAQAQYIEAKQFITQIYQCLKIQAEESNTWRLNEYCQRFMQQIQERFAYGKQNGIDFSSALSAKGYQSEAQFMQALQTKIMNAQNQGDIQNALQECEAVSQMVQQMQQSLDQEISSQQQNQQSPNATSGSGGSGGDNSEGSGAGDAQGGNGASGSKGGK